MATMVVRLHEADNPLAPRGEVVGHYSEDEVMVRWDNQPGLSCEYQDELTPVRNGGNDGSELVGSGSD